MFNSRTATLKAVFGQFLSNAGKDGMITDKWRTDFNAGKLSLDDALALKVILDH